MKTQLEFNIPKDPSEKYIRILEILSRIPEDKLDRLVTLLSKLDFIENDNSLVFNEDTIFKFWVNRDEIQRGILYYKQPYQINTRDWKTILNKT